MDCSSFPFLRYNNSLFSLFFFTVQFQDLLSHFKKTDCTIVLMKLFSPLSKEQDYAICIGTGRFLRAVLVPVLRQLGLDVFLCQTRGESFVQAMVQSNGTFVVDTVNVDGSISTDSYEICGVSSLASAESKHLLLDSVVHQMKTCQVIGFGVTEAGLDAQAQAMNDLAELLHAFYLQDTTRCFSILNTDNVPANGTVIAQCLVECAFTRQQTGSDFSTWLDSNVTCHNTMVDRITAARPNDALVPYAEPLPKKALVIEDSAEGDKLHAKYDWNRTKGVVFRHVAGEIENDHVLKLCIANGIHTAMVYVMGLCQMNDTRACLDQPLILKYLDDLFYQDIVPGLMQRGNIQRQEAIDTYQDWIQRLCHPFFGMNCFFVAQNTSTKLSIRLLSTANAALASTSEYHMSPVFAFAIAVALRFLTPFSTQIKETERGPVFQGALDLKSVVAATCEPEESNEYVTGLFVHSKSRTYDFRDPNPFIPKLLMKVGTQGHAMLPSDIRAIITQALGCLDGVDLKSKSYQKFSHSVSNLYLQMLPHSPSGSIMDVLETVVHPKELVSTFNIGTMVESAVQKTKIIDVHTHLFPPSHGQLMLWGIDELLTYHYLVAEYFMTASTFTPDAFYAKPKSEQADLIWEHLFIQRSPISEACRGVISTCQALGLASFIQRRDLKGIRHWFSQQDELEYVHRVFDLANLDYVIMTNIPFEPEEARYWLDPDTRDFDRQKFRSALRVDQLLNGDWGAISKTLEAMGIEQTLSGVKTLLMKWIDIMQPEYFMASVPHTFTYPSQEDVEAYAEDVVNAATLLRRVLLPLAAEYQLPIAFKFDSVRQMNPRLKTAGDGVKPSNVGILHQLCLEYPRIKFLATFLSRVNQHEVCVLANKFANLHIYGCWW